MKTGMLYDVLYGYSGLVAERTELQSVKEVADFIHTHGGGMITTQDDEPLLEIWHGEFEYCNDMELKNELMTELRKGEGFEDRYEF